MASSILSIAWLTRKCVFVSHIYSAQQNADEWNILDGMTWSEFLTGQEWKTVSFSNRLNGQYHCPRGWQRSAGVWVPWNLTFMFENATRTTKRTEVFVLVHRGSRLRFKWETLFWFNALDIKMPFIWLILLWPWLQPAVLTWGRLTTSLWVLSQGKCLFLVSPASDILILRNYFPTFTLNTDPLTFESFCVFICFYL